MASVRLWAIAAFAVACAGCEGGAELTFRRAQGSPSPTPTPGAISVVETIPADEEVGVDFAVMLSAKFSAALDPGVQASWFVLKRDSEEVEGSVAVVGSSAVFTPVAPLRYLGDYAATLTAVESLEGDTLAEPYEWMFRTRDLSWSPSLALEMNGGAIGGLTGPVIAANPDGMAWAVWAQDDGTVDSLFASAFVLGTGWSPPELIEQSAGDAFFPAVAADVDGSVITVWVQGGELRANRLASGIGWGFSEVIDASSGGFLVSDRGLTVAVDTAGNAVTAWAQTDGTRYNIWANRYEVGTGWGTALLIENDNTGNATEPQVAVASDGSTCVVWQHFDGTRNNIMAARYVPGVGWGAPQALETLGGTAARPAVVANNDRVIAAWVQDDGLAFNAYSSVYIDSLGWSVPEPIEQIADDADALRLAIAADGVVFACWSQRGATTETIMANRYTPGLGWDEAAVPIQAGAGLADDCDLTTDASGQATAIWRRDTLLGRARFLPSSGWAPAESFAGNFFDIASSADGRTYLIWTAGGDLLGSQFE